MSNQPAYSEPKNVDRSIYVPGFGVQFYRRKDGWTRFDGHVHSGAHWEEDVTGGATFRLYLTDDERRQLAEAIWPEGKP